MKLQASQMGCFFNAKKGSDIMRDQVKLHDFNTYMHDTVTETGFGKSVLTQRWVDFKFVRVKDGNEFSVNRPLDLENNREDMSFLYAIEDLIFADFDREGSD